jgi:uncharacterized protein YhfF/RimJ/RimL family protein N-acetyltransferase
MEINADQCEVYWTSFLETLGPNDTRRNATPDSFAFAGGGELADELLLLVLSRAKQATASLPIEYTATGEPLPKAGDLSIILDSQNRPAAIIERTSVEVVPFQDVGEEFAACEGEGDGSLHYWREAHTWYFNTVCERLGGKFEPKTEILCQKFKLVWPPDAEIATLACAGRNSLPDMKIELRNFRLEDASEVAQLVGDKEVSKWTANIPFPYSEQDAIDWISTMYSDSSRRPYAVEMDGRLVACVSYWPHEPEGVEVGYWVGRDFWGKGICTNALKQLLASNHFPARVDVFAKVMAQNIGSQRVLEKCGFSFIQSGSVCKSGNEIEARFYVRRTAT